MKSKIFIIGLLLYLGTFAYNMMFSISPRFGPIDMMVALTGLFLSAPFLLSFCEEKPIRYGYLLFGVFLTLLSLNDLIGISVSESTGVMLMDVVIFLTGAMLMVPYLASLGKSPAPKT
ncbi:MAG: hypothetical protein V1703_04920 [Candidatus Altiarchaeota archaeon]